MSPNSDRSLDRQSRVEEGAVAWAMRHRSVTALGPVYGWFSEEFDTADLKEAIELLEQIRWSYG